MQSFKYWVAFCRTMPSEKPLALLALHDDYGIAPISLELLASKGYTTETVKKDESPLDRCKSTAYDAVIMDANFPIMGGNTVRPALDVYRCLLERELSQIPDGATAWKTPKFLAITGYPYLADQLKTCGVPALAKPFKIAEVLTYL